MVAVWSPTLMRWVYGILDGLPFGVSSAVLEFNRVPSFLVAVARRWLAIPVISFCGDFKIIAVAAGKLSEDFYFRELVESVIGYRLDADKHQAPSKSCVFLGTLETYAPADQLDWLLLQPKPGRLQEIRDAISSVLRTGALSSGDAASLRGRLLHLAGVFAARLLLHFEPFVQGRSEEVSPALEFALLFTLELLDVQPWRWVFLGPHVEPQVAVVSDASFEPGSDGIPRARVCYIVTDPSFSIRRGRVFDIPMDFLRCLREREHQIALCEALRRARFGLGFRA